MSRPLLVLGAGGHGKVVADAAMAGGAWAGIVFLDDAYPEGGEVAGWPVKGDFEHVAEYMGSHDVIVALGDNALREKWLSRLVEQGFTLATVIHPSACVADSASLGEGGVIMAGAIVNCDASLGRGCIVNTSASIDHDNILGSCVHVSPGAHLGGEVSVGDRSWIGLGASVINNVTIGRDCIIGAGSVVLKAVTDGETVVGNPARSL